MSGLGTPVQEPILVPGELRAYRAWMFTADLTTSPRLRSVSYGGNSLDPRCGTYTARCLHSSKILSTRSHPVDEETGEELPVPAEGCTCGFYGVVVGGLHQAYMLSAGIPIGTSSALYIAGSVMMSGRIVLGARGVVRAEHMRLEALFGLAPELLVGLKQNMQMASEIYGKPVLSDPHEFERRFPLPDMTALWPGAVKYARQTAESADQLLFIKEGLHKMNYDTERCDCPDCIRRAIERREHEKRNKYIDMLLKTEFLPTERFWKHFLALPPPVRIKGE